MHQPYGVRLGRGQAQRCPALDGQLEPPLEQLGVDVLVAISAEDAHGDGRARRVQPSAQEIAARVLDLDLLAGQGSPFDPVHGLSKHPWVAGPDRLDVSRLQHDACHGQGPSTLVPHRLLRLELLGSVLGMRWHRFPLLCGCGLAALALPELAGAASDCPEGDWFCEPPPPALAQPALPQPEAEPAAGAPPELDRPAPGDGPRVLIDVENVRPASRRKHRRFREWGVGLHFTGGLMGGDQSMSADANMNGLGGALRFRPIPHLAIEGSLELAWGTDYNGFQRFEDALLVSALLFANPRSAVQFYGLAGFGSGTAFVELEAAGTPEAPVFRDETYSYLGVHLGFGLEARVTKHFAVGGDLVGFVRRRTDGFSRENPEFTDPVTGRTSNASGGGLLRAGVAFYW